MTHLKGGSSQKKTALSVKVNQCLPTLTFKVLDVVCFVQNQVVPFLSFESKTILNCQLVRSNDDVVEVCLAYGKHS